MMTIKLVELNGHEQIRSVKTVAASPSPENGANTYRVSGWDQEDLHWEFEKYGNVYVMNDAGQTVSRYWLGNGETD